jgi:hypothetical protein
MFLRRTTTNDENTHYNDAFDVQEGSDIKQGSKHTKLNDSPSREISSNPKITKQYLNGNFFNDFKINDN